MLKKYLLFSTLLLSGCLQPIPTSSDATTQDIRVQDENLHAGATSSTNWPAEDAGRKPQIIKGSSGSSLVLNFLDSVNIPVKMSGIAKLYLSGTIPAFSAPESLSLGFAEAESLIVDFGMLERMGRGKPDTLSFSIVIEFDGMQAYLPGFTYSTRLKKFLRSPFSIEPNFSTPISAMKYSFRISPDTALANMRFSLQGKSVWCFYIPESPFFFTVSPDSAGTDFDIGPILRGAFPLRILKLTKIDGRTDQNLLEVYEAIVTNVKLDSIHHGRFPTIKTGTRLFTTLLDTSISIRSTGYKSD